MDYGFLSKNLVNTITRCWKFLRIDTSSIYTKAIRPFIKSRIEQFKMELAKLPMISLQRQALTNFASSVWISASKQSLRYPLHYFFHHESNNDEAIAELERSNIPTLFKEMTMMILDEVGREIFDWLYEIEDDVNDTTLEHQLSNLSWTVEGSLNRPKMARLLLENQSDLDFSFSFYMTCTYGLEDKVRELWPRIGEGQELKDYDNENWMVQYWIYKLDEDLLNPPNSFFLDRLLDGTSIDVQFFVRVVRESDLRKSTVKFLFINLTEDEKIQALDSIFKQSNYAIKNFLRLSEEPAVGYLLSQLNYTQMCALVSKFEPPEELLMNISYFAWPNTHIIKALDHYIGRMEGAIEATNCNDLVEFADGAFKFVRRYNQTILFRYCWTRFSKEELNEVTDSMFIYEIISELALNKDDVSIKMVIDSIEPKSYAKHLLTHDHLPIIETLATYDTDLLKYYLARTVVSENLAKNLLKKLKDFIYLQPIKDTTTVILIQLFPEFDPNCSD